MTINGPAPIILAFFMNTAIDQQVEKYLRETSALGRGAARRSTKLFEGTASGPPTPASCRTATTGSGSGCSASPATRSSTPKRLRRDQGRDAADRARHRAGRHPQGGPGAEHLHLLDRVRAAHDGRHPAVSSSTTRCATSTRCRSAGYHIAEAGANPISQLAFTLANGFTIVEYYLARGMKIDDFAPNLSFFFSNGMDPEYSGDRPRRAAHLGARDARALRRQRRAARC